MAKFRDSAIVEDPAASKAGDGLSPAGAGSDATVHDRAIGDIIRDVRNLTAEQVEEILRHQRETGLRFGEAAVALGHASRDDVLYALSQQFHYPYSPQEHRLHSEELVAINKPFGPQAEFFRGIRSQLLMRLFNGTESRPPALAVISPDSGDGKTFVASNLAVTLAQLGGRTLLVDGNLRDPRVGSVFGREGSAGLSSLLAGRSETNVIQQVSGIPSLFVLPVGTTPPNPLELVERPAFGLLMRELTSKFDHVIVDTPAACHGADYAAISAKCGAAMVLARKNRSRVDDLLDVVGSVSGTPTRLVGTVVNEF